MLGPAHLSRCITCMQLLLRQGRSCIQPGHRVAWRGMHGCQWMKKDTLDQYRRCRHTAARVQGHRISAGRSQQPRGPTDGVAAAHQWLQTPFVVAGLPGALNTTLTVQAQNMYPYYCQARRNTGYARLCVHKRTQAWQMHQFYIHHKGRKGRRPSKGNDTEMKCVLFTK